MYHTHLTYLKAWIIATQEEKLFRTVPFQNFPYFPLYFDKQASKIQVSVHNVNNPS